jgi:alkylation response protein AidB-like acyl-CoA dehydrogenase
MPMFDPPRHAGPLLELGFEGLTAGVMMGFPLGVARRALDELIALAPRKRRGVGAGAVADGQHAQMRIGQAEATIQSARAFALEAVGGAWLAIRRDGRCTVDQRKRIALAARHAMRAATEAVELTSDLAGAAVVYEDHPIGRCARDLHAARHHIMFSGEGFAEYARHVLDLAGTANAAPTR